MDNRLHGLPALYAAWFRVKRPEESPAVADNRIESRDWPPQTAGTPIPAGAAGAAAD